MFALIRLTTEDYAYSSALILSLIYLPQRRLQSGIVSVEDAAQRVIGFQLSSDAQRRLQHASVCVPTLAVEAPLLAHRLQLNADIRERKEL